VKNNNSFDFQQHRLLFSLQKYKKSINIVLSSTTFTETLINELNRFLFPRRIWIIYQEINGIQIP